MIGPDSIREGVRRAIRRTPASVVLQVVGAADPDAVVRVLRDAGDVVVAGRARHTVCFMAAGGPVVSVDTSGLGGADAVGAAVEVARLLADAGLADGELLSPKWRRMPAELVNVKPAPAAVLRAIPAGRARTVIPSMPRSFIEAAVGWVCEGRHGDEPVAALVGHVPVEVAVRSAADAAEVAASGVAWLMTGAEQSTARLAVVYPSVGLLLAGGGPAATPAALAAWGSTLTEWGSRLAPDCNYAAVWFSPKFETALAPLWDPDRKDRPQWDRFAAVSADYVYDAAPFQVLTRAHVARLGDDVRAQCTPLAGERWALALGDIIGWVEEGPRRAAALAAGRAALAPLIVDDAKARA